MANRVLLFSVAALSCLVQCSPTPAASVASCKYVDSLSWQITDFEWRTGYIVYSYNVGVGPAPPPPPSKFYNCGEAMLRMNITSIGTGVEPTLTQQQTIPCVEQTNDAKLANMTDLTDYSAGPMDPPPASPHWFTCDMDNQLFIYPNGTSFTWPLPDRLVGNLTTQIRLDPVKMTLEVAQSWACEDEESETQVEVTGIAHLPPLACRGRTNLEPDANFLINSPFMNGPGYGQEVHNGSVCTGPEFLIRGHVSG
ncbi:hypothetical protein HD806DRAFT_171042 [Xylariaceae sp. AK1471]|nr:hypothetical protein HD806DRAFT_171042 [Xylariaceae sp. AK1471]